MVLYDYNNSTNALDVVVATFNAKGILIDEKLITTLSLPYVLNTNEFKFIINKSIYIQNENITIRIKN
jgi:hypothetical protein